MRNYQLVAVLALVAGCAGPAGPAGEAPAPSVPLEPGHFHSEDWIEVAGGRMPSCPTGPQTCSLEPAESVGYQFCQGADGWTCAFTSFTVRLEWSSVNSTSATLAASLVRDAETLALAEGPSPLLLQPPVKAMTPEALYSLAIEGDNPAGAGFANVHVIIDADYDRIPTSG